MNLLKSSRRYQEGVKRVSGSFGGVLDRIPATELSALRKRMTADAAAQGLVYQTDDGVLHPIDVMLRPRLVMADQRAYLHRVCGTLQGAHEKLLDLWFGHQRVRRLLPLGDAEERWMTELRPPKGLLERLFCRFDASVDFADPRWVERCPFFESNTTGVGGIHFTAAVDALAMDIVSPTLQRAIPALLLDRNDDPRLQLLEVLADRARELGLRRFNVAMAQFKDLVGGPQEFELITQFMRSRGVEAVDVDPRELRVRGEELYARDTPVDIVYRDHETAELARVEAEGHDLSGLRWAFAHGRVVSSLAGEFDHKSAYEVFTSSEFDRAFTADERRVFRRHVPWTRLVREVLTDGPEGEEVDLVPFVRAHREALVLKPNRGFGGEGIVLGREATDSEWDSGIDVALTEPSTWVVQRYRPVAEKQFPRVNDDGSLRFEEYFCVLGFYVSPQGLGILGRVSRKKVVNVSQKGGLVSVLRVL